MASSSEVDPLLRYALKLLHSPSTDSAEKIRNALDDLIKQRHGPSKMLANTLNKKYIAEECKAPGSGAPRQSSSKSSEPKASTSSASPSHVTVPTTEGISASTSGSVSIKEEPLVISVPDDDNDDDVMMEEDHMKELEDLMCVVCRRMDVSARNRLIECADCHSLYHQECHKPSISDSDANEQEFSWCCSLCKNKIKSASVASPAKSSSSHSSSSSSSSSSYRKSSVPKSYEQTVQPSSSNPTSSSSSSHKSKSKLPGSSSSSSKYTSQSQGASGSNASSSHSGANLPSTSSGNSSSSSSSAKPTVNINIISADKRLQNMKKKAAKLQETRRKHK